MTSAPVPAVLASGPFTTAQALRAGVSADVIRGPSYAKLLRGVFVAADVELNLVVWLHALLLASPRDAVVSHVTALRLYGLEIGTLTPFHVSTGTTTRSRATAITVHRRRHRIGRRELDGIPVTGPERTIVDIATKVTLVELVQAAEFLIHQGHTTLDKLVDYAATRHLDGVHRTRRAIRLIRAGVESPMETIVRLMLVFARLPEPLCNAEIRDAAGTFLARGDLVYSDFLVLIEYDGWHHERNAWQRQHDIVRRERLEEAGWRVIVITAKDLDSKAKVVRRVHQALVERGYDGREPHINAMWRVWFK